MSYTGKNIDLSKYEKYGKKAEAVELSKIEVELGSIKEIDSYIKILKANIQESEKEGAKYSKAESTLIKAWAELNNHRNAIYQNAYSNAPKVLNEFKAKAKALGIDASSFFEVEELERLIKDTKEYVQFFDKIKRPTEQV